ncbi:DUF3267 domain-containing protein [Flavobacterium sp. KACC 22761]|uniref:DUF3267 domain-containing protein n=1 Tax=Flavobacterium sp. KACC 22761 TaxID=3092665 RepID=UPI002A75763B|nr:DUF3267 domain-containing protein [Flavobacterium sp. KACC 22761]WPO80242.1 DUF3267 domain-containing protein [Flavobacterium sp. KACC 22761]
MKEISIDSKKVQLWGILISIPIILVFLLILFFNWGEVFNQNLKDIKASIQIFDSKIANTILIFLVPNLIIFTAIIVHELIHGFFMALFSKKGWKSVKFGFIKKHLMPFANCTEPLKSKKMLIVSLSPFFILGLLPSIYGFLFKDLVFLFIGFSMTLGAVGDFIYAYLILKAGLNHTLLDHKSQVGFIIID